MSKKVKTRRDESRFQKPKSIHIWVIFGICLLIMVQAILFFLIMQSLFAGYLFNSKITDEYISIEKMAKIYEKSSSREETLAFLDEMDRVYCILDSNGEVIHENGENTIGDSRGMVELDILAANQESKAYTYVYLDENVKEVAHASEDGEFEINLVELAKYALDEGSASKDALTRDNPYVQIPLWLEIDVNNGEQFFGKVFFRISLSDLIFIFVLFAGSAFIVSCVIALIIVNLISTLASQRKVTKAFFNDPITNGHNWMWFTYKGEKTLKRKRNAAIDFAVLDVVFVKYRNYCVCHSIKEGEEMLWRVDQILKNSLEKKEISAHYSSANFSMLLKYTDKEKLEERIKGIIDKLEHIDSEHTFTFHVGVYPVDRRLDKKGKFAKRKDINIEREYNNACTARATLSECDDSGVAFFDEELVAEQIWIDTVMERFDSAIKNEEFVVYYQPKYDPKTDLLRGVEALIRWNSPELGFKPPSTFIPILEKNGKIPDIDHYMITHVARDQKKWLDEGLECVPASVNVSRAHFIEKDLAQQIKNDVDAEGAPHELIEIEVTESAFFDDKRAMINTIRELKEYGFQVSMDDFGSGYSSLNSLKDMPLDVLKLDAEFFRGDLEDKRGEIVVSEALKLAKNLNMVTVAEGVEAREQVDFLAKHGCDMIQGYIYARPMEPEKYVKCMENKYAIKEESSEYVKPEEEKAQSETKETSNLTENDVKTEETIENAPEEKNENTGEI